MPKIRRPHDQKVQRRQRQVPHAGKDRHEQDVGDEVDGERQRDQPRHLLTKRLREHEVETDGDDGIKNRPDHADRPGRGRP